MKLYSYFRSSASYRVRIALNLKGISYDYLPVHLLRDGGEQFAPSYREINPDRLVPTLVDDAGVPIPQSLAIIEYLEETHPTPPLLPRKPADRAYVRSLALQIASEIHPLNNLRVLKYLTENLGVNEGAKNAWYCHWVEAGFSSLEARLAGDARTGTFCYGDAPTLADLCLVPQVFNARRFSIDVNCYPTLARINDNALQLEAFAKAAPDRQYDAL
ncbi:maleylacetoacetate isomerase [Paraburkholderia phenoliruptrix]|uniref:Maleylacetoacetate isomerase n=2 Tax=Paraburkholderia phenoliruptrix TaxID=252970 RepID=K0DMB2_9BURK|nr:maleylacetoacetate isomerase [Paraburkholderia phenoliruptrix]AFT86040.1 maleylacetoacetate isomerase [Paraburkholderia phenoliruptrix BR3459a]CAB4048575.1 Maleylpyruvate isomerase [Paraburkholderia phenoliruptrix]